MITNSTQLRVTKEQAKLLKDSIDYCIEHQPPSVSKSAACNQALALLGELEYNIALYELKGKIS